MNRMPLRRALTRGATGALCGAVVLLWIAATSASGVCTEPILFDGGTSIATGSNPLYFAAADFNEDGFLDLAVTNSDWLAGGGGSSLAILLGSETGLAPSATYPLGLNPHDVVARDFDEDGILDLAVANKYSGNVSVHLGQGAGGVGNGLFAPGVPYETGGQSFQLRAADFNEDGILDLAASINSGATVNVLPGLGSDGVGSGAFGPPVLFAIDGPSRGLEAEDLDGDGHVDIVTTEYPYSTIAVLMGTGSGTIGPASFAAPDHYVAGLDPFDLAIGDLDGDGELDLAVANTSNAGTTVLIGGGDGSFLPPATPLPSGNSGGVAILDANHDGIPDLAACSVGQGPPALAVFLGAGSGEFVSDGFYPVGADPYQVVIGDFDHDGSEDAVVSGYTASFVTLLRGLCESAPVDPRYPDLTDVRDVPGDQGGHVFLTWAASSLDVYGGSVNSYRVWRRVPPAAAAATRERLASTGLLLTRPVRGTDGVTLVEYWEALATLPAQRLEGYGYTAATTQDSTPAGNPFTAFFVTALTPNIDVYYSSNVDSGYSVDNIPPLRPRQFAGEPQGATAFSLSWEESAEPDFLEFRLHRGGAPDFVPDESNLLAVVHEPGFTDDASPPTACYKLAALDLHGNVSEFASVVRNGPVGIGDDPVWPFALRRIAPNPSFGGRLSVAFTLPSGESARLEVIDVQGRRVTDVRLTSLEPGLHVREVGDLRPLAPGVYFVKLSQGKLVRQAKAVVLP